MFNLTSILFVFLPFLFVILSIAAELVAGAQ